MKKQIKKLWVEALTSGKYKQTTETLREDNKFCCLGVLCDLYRKENGTKWQKDDCGAWCYITNDTELPKEVMEWAGLTEVGGDSITINGNRRHMASHNDGGRTFTEIAAAIKKQL